MNKEKEEKLRDFAQYKANQVSLSGSTHNMKLRDRLFDFAKSKEVAEYHTPTVDLTGLKSKFIKLTDNMEVSTSNKHLIWTLLEPYLKPNEVKDVDLTELRKEFERTFINRFTPNDVRERMRDVFNWTCRNIQPKQDKESDAVEFAEWLRVECNCFDSSPNWYYLNNGENSPKTSKELYDIFTNSKTNNR